MAPRPPRPPRPSRYHREERKHRLNREIMAPEVRVTGPDNEPLGVMSLMEAMRQASELDLDVIEIVATATPPVVRIMDYGKFKYQEQKKEHEAKLKQTVIEIKEVKFRPGTDDGDYNIKLRNIRRFLDDGDKVKITLRFRGREITHQELGMALLMRIKDDLADVIIVESMPKLEGKQMIMMIAPGKKKPASAKPAAATEPKPATVSDPKPAASAPAAKPSAAPAAVAVAPASSEMTAAPAPAEAKQAE